MESNDFIIWLKTLCNAIVGSDTSNYFKFDSTNESSLPPPPSSTNKLVTATTLMENSDSNNNTEQCHAKDDESIEIVSVNNPDPQLLEDQSMTMNHIPNIVKSVNISNNDDDYETIKSDSIAEAKETTTLLANNTVCNDVERTVEPCCDIIKYKNQLCQDIRSSPLMNCVDPDIKLKIGQMFKSSKLIENIIDMIRNRGLLSLIDPFTSKRSLNFRISPFISVVSKDWIITGFSNIEKANNDGIIRCVNNSNSRFAIDCAIFICNLQVEGSYSMKFGQKWFKRPCIRNKKFTIRMDRCLVYAELKINTQMKQIRFERFSPISQQNIRCETKPFSVGHIDKMFSKLLQSYFEKNFAANVLKLETRVCRFLDKKSLFKYDEIITNTALAKCFEYFPTSTAIIQEETTLKLASLNPTKITNGTTKQLNGSILTTTNRPSLNGLI